MGVAVAETFATIRGHTIYVPGITPGSVVLDLGANEGEFARQMSARFGGTYHLVEANPVLAERLRANGQFSVWECAVAASEGTIPFHVARNAEASSILTLPSESVYDAVLQETIEVRARTLESLLADIGAPTIDLVKMDIEGAEVGVLSTLPRRTLVGIGQISVEFHSDPTFGFNLRDDVERVIRLVRRSEFECFDFARRPRLDVLFLNQRVHPLSAVNRITWRPAGRATPAV